MSETGPRGPRPVEQPATAAVPPGVPSGAHPAAPPAAPAPDRMARFTWRNMIWSLVPLVAICLVLVGWSALKYDHGDPVRTVETETAVRAAAEVAGYQVLVPQGLGADWRSTSVRTNAGAAQPGDRVTLEIGWYTPDDEYAGYVISDDPRASALTDVLRDAKDDGTVQIAGTTWDRRTTTTRGETALTRTAGTARLLITGSASEHELEALAAAVRPVTAPSS